MSSSVPATTKKRRSSLDNIRPRAWFVRFMLRYVARFFAVILSRTRVEGLENIPEGAAIYAANHASIYDAILYFAYLPFRTQYVGPGDFRLRYPNRIAAEWTDVILVDRGSRDTSSLRAMVDTLKSGAQIGLFPEGGTWEKGLYNVKDGAAYLSQATAAPIVPIAISGAYDLWGRIWRFERPEIVMKILPPMPPVEKARGAGRKKVLEDASIDLMHRIYTNLEPDELDRYKLYMRQRFQGQFVPEQGDNPFPAGHNFAMLADVISKKNLFSTFHEHLKLPLRPFLNPENYHTAAAIRESVESLYQALTGELDGYMDYRRGEKARNQILLELEEIRDILTHVDNNKRFKFNIMVEELPIQITIDKPDKLPEDVV